MPIEFSCQGCGETLRVPEQHANKKARCPKCQSLNLVPGGATVNANEIVFTSAATTASEQPWFLKLEDGSVFGPVLRSELEKWHLEGRITPRSQVRQEPANEWRWAGEIWSSLGIPLSANNPANSFVPPPQQTQVVIDPAQATNPFSEQAYNPYAAPQSGASVSRSGRPHRGGLILVLGLVGMFFCVIVAPFAVAMGHTDLKAMREGRMDREGHGLTVAGTILGWIGVAQLGFTLLIFFLFFLGAAVGR